MKEQEARLDALRLMWEQAPFNRLLGLKGESLEAGHAVITLPVREEFVGDPRRPALHGVVVSSLIDTTGGAAAWAALGPGESVSTVDLRVDFLEPARLAGPCARKRRYCARGTASATCGRA